MWVEAPPDATITMLEPTGATLACQIGGRHYGTMQPHMPPVQTTVDDDDQEDQEAGAALPATPPDGSPGNPLNDEEGKDNEDEVQGFR
jgi:hypothetical protein